MIAADPLLRRASGPVGRLCAALLVLGGVAASAQETCLILDDCSGIDSLPTAEVCAEDDCSCAQQVEYYLRNQSPTTNWPMVPGGQVQLNRSFFHDRYIGTWISPDALDDWLRFADPASGPVSVPDQTVVYKLGYLPSSDDPALPGTAQSGYVFVKLDGYCPDGSTIGDICLGGDWFSLEIDYASYGSIIGVGDMENQGKVALCFGCHGPAERADWLWGLYSMRRYP